MTITWITKKKYSQITRNEIETNNIDGYDMTTFISVGYDSPMTLWDRRNEIIFEKKWKNWILPWNKIKFVHTAGENSQQ